MQATNEQFSSSIRKPNYEHSKQNQHHSWVDRSFPATLKLPLLHWNSEKPWREPNLTYLTLKCWCFALLWMLNWIARRRITADKYWDRYKTIKLFRFSPGWRGQRCYHIFKVKIKKQNFPCLDSNYFDLWVNIKFYHQDEF